MSLTKICLGIALFAACDWGQIVTTVAGTDWFFPSNVPASTAPLGYPHGAAIDGKGNLYLTDDVNSIVVKISTDGVLTVVAGNGAYGFSGDNGPATGASLSGYMAGVAVDAAGNVYIDDTNNNRIRKVTPDGTISTVAGNGTATFSGDGGPATSAGLNPWGVAVDSSGNLYIADEANYRIRQVTPEGVIRTIAGNGNRGFSGDGGPATSASLADTNGIAVDASGNVYICDYGNFRVRKIAINGIISTVAGNGTEGYSGDSSIATDARLGAPYGVAVDAGGSLYISDYNINRVRKVMPNGVINTVAGNGGSRGFSGDGGLATNAGLDSPIGPAVDAAGNLYFIDFGTGRIRKVSPNGIISTIAGTGRFAGDGGPATSAKLSQPQDVAVDASGNIYILDLHSQRIRKVTPNGTISTVAGSAVVNFSGDGIPAFSATLSSPMHLTLDSSGSLYIADTFSNRIRRITPSGLITTVAGNGTKGYSGDGGAATDAALSNPKGVAVDSAGNLYIADTLNNRIRKVTNNGFINTIAGTGAAGLSGDDGPATNALLNQPYSLAVDASGNLFIGDTVNNRVRKVSPNGVISTVAGGTIAVQPLGMATDTAGNLYIAGQNRVRKLAPDGTLSTVTGTGVGVFSGDGGPATNAGMNAWGVSVDASGNIYIADDSNSRIRKVVASAPSITASPANLTFIGTAAGNAPPPETVNLASSIAGLSFTTSSSAPWLSVTPSSGVMPSSLQVSVDPSHLSAGTYQGSITVAAPLASPPTATIAVSLTIQTSGSTQLTIGAQSLSFAVSQGGAAQTRQLQVSNSGSGTLSFGATSTTATGGPWLSVAPANGTATLSSPASLTVAATPGALSPGTYRGAVVIFATDLAGGTYSSLLPATLSVGNPGANILVSQSGLAFTGVAQGGAPLPQTFGILNTGQGSMNWSATSSTISGGNNWLRISPVSGTVVQPYLDVSTVSVSIDPTGLAAGTYYGRIQVSASAANSPQVLTVVLTVLPAGSSPGPEVRPSGLIFTGLAGTMPDSQDVMLGNPKATLDSYQSGTVGKGFSYLPTSANVPPNQPTVVRVSPDFSALQPGEIDHGGITLLFSDGTLRTVSVLSVVAPAASTAGIGLQATGCSSNKLEVQWRAPLQNFAATLGQPTTLEVQVVDDCGNLVGPGSATGATVVATFSNKDSDLNLTHVGNGVWTGTWKPVKASSGPATIAVTSFNSTSQVLQSGQASLSGTLGTSLTPVVTAGGVVHAASAAGGVPIAPGSLITIYGSNLADAQGLASTLPLPQSQNGAQVLLGNTSLPILYTSNGQLNVQVPFSTPVNTQYQLSVQRDSLVSLPEQLVVAQASPGVFTVNQQGTGQGVIFKHDGVTLAQSGTPAVVGETVVIYCTGLGAVSPAVADGTPAPSSPLSNTVNPVTVTMGGMNATVSFSGLTPGYPGLYQINAVVPDGVSGGAIPVVVSVAGQTSPPVTLAVQ